jgi:hypothetical protein
MASSRRAISRFASTRLYWPVVSYLLDIKSSGATAARYMPAGSQDAHVRTTYRAVATRMRLVRLHDLGLEVEVSSPNHNTGNIYDVATHIGSESVGTYESDLGLRAAYERRLPTLGLDLDRLLASPNC